MRMSQLTDFFNNLIFNGFSDSPGEFPERLGNGHTLGLSADAEVNSLLKMRFVRLSQLAYASEADARSFLGQHFPEVTAHYISQGVCQCYLLREGDDVVLVFRGTQPTSVKDWLLDAKTNLVSAQGIHSDIAGEVHQGFFEGFTGLRPSIQDWLDQHPGYAALRYWISGHSLGGALATLCTAWLGTAMGVRAYRTITFGQPRVGSQQFATAFNAVHQDRFHRLVNGTDTVANLPFAEMPRLPMSTWAPFAALFPSFEIPVFKPQVRQYQHVGNLEQLGSGGLIANPVDHGLSNPSGVRKGYLESLQT
jgi:hypothetical protein